MRIEDQAVVDELVGLSRKLDHMIAALRAVGDYDPRWIAVGETHLVKGMEAVTKAVMRPSAN